MVNKVGLSGWVLEQVKSGRFPSIRQFALQSDLSQTALNNVIERGRADPETLVKLARATGVNPARLFSLAGWLTEEDLKDVPIPELSVEEVGWVQMLRETRPDFLRPILAGLRVAWEQSRGESPDRPVNDR